MLKDLPPATAVIGDRGMTATKSARCWPSRASRLASRPVAAASSQSMTTRGHHEKLPLSFPGKACWSRQSRARTHFLMVRRHLGEGSCPIFRGAQEAGSQASHNRDALFPTEGPAAHCNPLRPLYPRLPLCHPPGRHCPLLVMRPDPRGTPAGCDCVGGVNWSRTRAQQTWRFRP